MSIINLLQMAKGADYLNLIEPKPIVDLGEFASRRT